MRIRRDYASRIMARVNSEALGLIYCQIKRHSRGYICDYRNYLTWMQWLKAGKPRGQHREYYTDVNGAIRVEIVTAIFAGDKGFKKNENSGFSRRINYNLLHSL
jgi:hypothetical protein